MSKPFDVSTKQLVEIDPIAWVRLMGLPGESAELINADLSTVVADADRILRVHDPDYLAHFEMQASYKVDIGERLLLYNVVAHYKYRKNIESVLLLLRRSADGPSASGTVAYAGLRFQYRVVRIWEKSPEELLKASIALLPLVPLTDVSVEELPDAVRRMGERIDAEVPIEDRGLIWTTTWLLMGLKYDPEFSRHILKGVMGMKESSTYQYTLEEGRVEGREQGREQGRVEEARRILLLLGGNRFGEPDVDILNELASIATVEKLELLTLRLFEVESWSELLRR